MSTSALSVVFSDGERRIEFEQAGDEVVVRLWQAQEYHEIRLTAEQVSLTNDFFGLVTFASHLEKIGKFNT